MPKRQTKLHNIEAAFDQVVSRLAYAYAQAGRSDEARALGQIELAHFSFLSSTHFLLAAIGIESDRIELTLRQARESHQSARCLFGRDMTGDVLLFIASSSLRQLASC
jgi:hypothetical protein